MPKAMPGTSRTVVKLRSDGNAIVLTVPRPMLTYLGWLPGDEMVIELLEDSTLRARPFTPADVPVRRTPRLVYDFSESEKP